MIKFKLTCPDCGAVVVAKTPQSMIWELCPSCKRHVWDSGDALMADIYVSDRSGAGEFHATN